MRTHTVIDSPYDKLTLVADGESLCGVYMVQQRHRPAEETFGHPDRARRSSWTPRNS